MRTVASSECIQNERTGSVGRPTNLAVKPDVPKDLSEDDRTGQLAHELSVARRRGVNIVSVWPPCSGEDRNESFTMNTTLVSVLIMSAIAGVAGWIGQAIADHRDGIIFPTVLGFIGALVGMWVAGYFDLPGYFALNVGSMKFPIVWSIAGAALFVATLILFPRRHTHRRWSF
jgi:uncharacterized membrane protein YeaQ/YmgE (transglycosylase-associated protein family)